MLTVKDFEDLTLLKKKLEEELSQIEEIVDFSVDVIYDDYTVEVTAAIMPVEPIENLKVTIVLKALPDNQKEKT